ncbi:DUF4349 domain-containing protein [Tissierella sp. Yu-01]|uniref:DUF4349 domain-containing protein n=1 Tax=Tissierella sp. Yu-01 TaxID=3035694 RepID=UPI00240CFEC6|nr:DUF4349 domain-containing protein [Tissierella sp. Yu-01]WFA08455.1 DUF4349 domain-containing protein [Tissierella sp. Yu-01]
MKGSKRLVLFAISILLVLSVVVGCSSSIKSENSVGSAPTSDAAIPQEAPAEAAEDRDSSFGRGVSSPLEPEKIITTIYLSFETTEFDKTNEELSKLIEKYKGYIEFSNISYNHYYNNMSYRYGEFSIRVPRENITSFKTELNVIGNLTSESTNKQDVTKQYTDTESRLKVIETKEVRLLALLEKAEKIEDIIALENQLSEVIYEKENLKASLLTLDDKIDFSTVNINIQEVAKVTATENIDTTFGTKVKNAIADSLYFFTDTLQGLIIALIYLLPFLVIIAVVVFVGVRFYRKYKKDKLV